MWACANKMEVFMKKYDIIIIGASAAGRTAAITAKRHYPDKSILIVRKSPKVPVPCGIPYIFGLLGDTDKNLMPDTPYENSNITIINDEVVSINRDKETISCKEKGEINYKRLVLATGSNPIKLPISGIDKENVFFIYKDYDYLKQMHQKIKDFKNIVIIGGGFIGVELADECKKGNDVNISIVERLPHCLMLTFDEEFAGPAEEYLKEKGVKVLINEEVEEISGNGKVEKVKLKSGKTVDADAVIIGVGASPEVSLAKQAGLDIGETGGIKVNQYMLTNDNKIYACGDCSEDKSFFTGKPIGLKLASIAAMEARICAANLFGTKRMDPGAIGVFSTRLGEVTLASAGLTEKMAEEHFFNVVVGEASGINRHPGKLPGAASLKIKLIFEKATGIILGGQILGSESAGEIINVVSACIQKRMTAEDIATFQTGTHPLLTASPVAYQLNNAAEIAVCKMMN